MAGDYQRDALRSLAHGGLDLGVGLGQLASQVGGALIDDPEISRRYEGARRGYEADYQGGRFMPSAPDIGRVTGNVVVGTPAVMARGAAAAPTLLGRMGQGARAGATISTAMPVEGTGYPADYFSAKAGQVAGGAVLGAVAVPAVEGLVIGAGAALNMLGRLGRAVFNTATGQVNLQTVENTLRVELERQGVNWGQLGQDVRSSLVTEVQGALRAGRELDPAALGRIADASSVGVTLTRGQASRVPFEFSREQNLARTEIGAPLAERFGQQNQQLLGALPAGDVYAGGQAAARSLAARDAPRRAAVTGAYQAARTQAGVETAVPMQPIAQRVGQVVEDFGTENIPGAVLTRLREFGLEGGTQTRVFNLREADKLRKLITNNIENPRSPSGAALTQLKAAVDDAVNSLAEGTAGAEVGAAFQQARDLASRRFANLERTPALREAIERGGVTAPEQFIERHAIRGSIQEVANFMRNLEPEARAEVRQAVVEWMRQRGTAGAGDTARFSQAGFNRALQTIGNRRLELIFAGDTSTLSQLRALARTASNVQVPPVGAGVNYSASGTAMIDFLDRISRLPFIGAAMPRGGDILRASARDLALTPGSPTIAGAPVISPELLRELSRGAGSIAGPVVPGAAFGLFGAGR